MMVVRSVGRMEFCILFLAAVAFALAVFPTAANVDAQTFDENPSIWPEPLKIAGSVLAGGDGPLPGAVWETFLKQAGGPEASILVVHGDDDGSLVRESFVNRFGAVVQIQTQQPAPCVNWSQLVENVTGVWLTGLPNLLDADGGLQQALQSVIDRGGVVGCDGSVSAQLGTVAISGDGAHADLTSGLGVFPGAIVTPSFGDSDAELRLHSALATHPTQVGVAVDAKTAALLSGRRITAIGSGKVHLLLAGSRAKPIRYQSLLAEGDREAGRIADLPAWRRDAIDRTLEPFPPAAAEQPFVENGTLLIVGGGRLPDGFWDSFVDLAGGKQRARLVYVPCTEREQLPADSRTVQLWKQMGVQHAVMVHTKNRNEADTDEHILRPLRGATGIWFGGGRQWNLADSYYGTTAHQLMKEVLQRGGVIGGSSAGASIQARYMARGDPLGNWDIMAPGYDRGLGFISGVAIDQHFSQRRRHKDMSVLVDTYPQLLGIGVDEGTVLSVQKSVGTVSGSGNVFFFDRHRPKVADQPDYVEVHPGGQYDLAARQIIAATPPEQPDESR